jgi:glyoxylase-like metal-dependent hydrolase (beta-lactamase superfamily II)
VSLLIPISIIWVAPRSSKTIGLTVLNRRFSAGLNLANTLALAYVTEEHFSVVPFAGFTVSTYRVQPAPLSSSLDDGDVLDIGDRAFTVLHVPGHSPGSIALWEKKTGLLFSGDCLYDGLLLDDLYHCNSEHFVSSMRRLRQLPVSVVHAGHFDSVGRARTHTLADEYIAGKRKPGCPME